MTQPTAKTASSAPDAKAALENDATEFASQREALAREQAGFEQQVADFEQAKNELERDRRRLAEAKGKVQTDQTAVDQARVELENERQALNARLAAAQEDAAELAAERTCLQTLSEETQALRDELEQKAQSIGGREADLVQREAQVEWLSNQLDADAALNQDQQQRLMELQAQLEAQKSQQRAEADELAKARADLENDQRELHEKQQACERLQQTQQDQSQDIQTQQQALAQQEAELDQRRQTLDQQAREQDQRQHDIQQRHDALASQQQQLAEQIAQTDQRRHELDQLAGDLALERQRHKELDAAWQTKQTQLQEAQAALDVQRGELEAAAKQQEDSKAHVDRQISELHEKQQAFRETLTKANQQLAVERQQLALRQKNLDALYDRIRDRRKQVKQVAGELDTRRNKLRKYRDVLRARAITLRDSESQTESLKAHYVKLLKQREDLRAAKEFLGKSEQIMFRRWATHRSLVLGIGVVVSLVFLGLMSYAIGQRAVDPVWQATATLGVTPLTPGQVALGENWVAGQREDILSEAVLNEALNLMQQRQVEVFPTVTAMDTSLADHLTVRSGSEGQVIIAYRHVDQQVVVNVVDALANALVNYRTALRSEGEAVEPTRIIQPALRALKPAEDQRLIMAGKVFGVLTAAAMVLALLVRLAVSRAGRVLDANIDSALYTLDDDKSWPKLDE